MFVSEEGYILAIDTNKPMIKYAEDLVEHCINRGDAPDLFLNWLRYVPEKSSGGDCYQLMNSPNWGCNCKGEYQKVTESERDEFNFPALFTVGILIETLDEMRINKIKAFAEDFFNINSHIQAEIEGFRVLKHDILHITQARLTEVN